MKLQITTGGRPEGVEREPDCVIRALAVYFDVPYEEAKALVLAHCRYNSKTGTRTSDYVRLMKSLGFEYVPKRIRVRSSNPEAKLPRKCVLDFAHHAAAYEDGTVYDLYVTGVQAGCKQTVGYYVNRADP